MNKFINRAILYVSIFAIEVLIIFISLTLIAIIQYGPDLFFIKGALRGTALWNFWRLLFYGLPYLILNFLLIKHVKKIKFHQPLLFAFFNLFIFVALSILSRIIWGKNIPLPPQGTMFWITCLAIFLSPLILVHIPYCNRLMELSNRNKS